MDKTDNQYRDNIRDSNDPEITRRLYQTLMPEWLMPNVRLKLQHFLPKDIVVVNTEQEYMAYFQLPNEKMEVYTFVRKLFEEHNACAAVSKYRSLHIETAYLFCMDAFEGTISSNFFFYIPRSYYRRYLEDVPLFYTTKVCIIVDYNRRLAYRFGIGVSKMMDDTEVHGEDRNSAIQKIVYKTTASRGTQDATHGRRRKAENLNELKCRTAEEIMAENRKINSKLREPKHQ